MTKKRRQKGRAAAAAAGVREKLKQLFDVEGHRTEERRAEGEAGVKAGRLFLLLSGQAKNSIKTSSARARDRHRVLCISFSLCSTVSLYQKRSRKNKKSTTSKEHTYTVRVGPALPDAEKQKVEEGWERGKH